MAQSGKMIAALASMLLIGSAPAAPSFAQEAAAVRPVPIPPTAVRVPCCRCLDGTTRTIAINSGTSPWQVSNPGAPNVFAPAVSATNVAWTQLPPARWIGPVGGNSATGDYVYQLQIYVPRCVIPATVRIIGHFAADNRARLLHNGNQIAASLGTPDYGFLPGSVTPFTVNNLTAGLHTLQLVVTNSGGPTGAVIRANVTSTCPRDLEHGGPRDLTEGPARTEIRAVEPQP